MSLYLTYSVFTSSLSQPLYQYFDVVKKLSVSNMCEFMIFFCLLVKQASYV